jgi:HEAT repeat protein
MSWLDESLVTSNPRGASHSQSALSEAPAPAPDATVAALCSGDFHDRWDRLRQIADLGEAALEDLIAILQDDKRDWEARWFAARALGNLPHAPVIAALIDTFASTTDDDLRQAVAAALSQIGPAAIATLGAQLAQPALRPVAVQALARIQHPDTIPPLLTVMDDPRATVRATAIDALSAYGDPVTLPVIEQSLGDPAALVRLSAIRGLVGLRSHLGGDRLVVAISPLLADADGQVAQQAIYALGRVPTAHFPLLARLETAPAGNLQAGNLQAAIVQALVWQGTPQSVAGAVAAWDRLDRSGRLALVAGLPSLSPTLRAQLLPTLRHWLRAIPTTPNASQLRCQLVWALGQMGGGEPSLLTCDQVSDLRSLLHDPDPAVQIHAEAALRLLEA